MILCYRFAAAPVWLEEREQSRIREYSEESFNGWSNQPAISS